MKLRAIIVILSLLLCGPVFGQSTEQPLVRVDLEDNEAIPGQPLSLRVTVLVPTWMTEPVVFPSLEAPDLMVRLPERSTTPVSERIEGDTWSGVSRNYRMSPMVPGVFNIPPNDLIITWSDPQTNEARRDIVALDGFTLSGVLPDGAEGLDPFIAAEEITLSQDLEGNEAPLQPGDSIRRTVTVNIKGTPPMFLPALLRQDPVEGIAQYPDEPVLSEKSERGVVSGTRAESVTYLAQSGGQGAAEPIAFDWFNLSTGQIETVSLDGFDLTVDAPVAQSVYNASVRRLAIALAVLTGCILLLLFAGPSLRAIWLRRKQVRRDTYLASEEFAQDRLQDAIAKRDLSACLIALALWEARNPSVRPRGNLAIQSALTALGSARYGKEQASDANGWKQLQAALRSFLNDTQIAPSNSALAPLNPR
ncbi:MAG: hypothetical protein R8G34_13490 [Paracoccaceae bacterium]|nr:hypothetical protein [Paracoccaceae bacterium]